MLWPGAATDLSNWQGPGMAVLYLLAFDGSPWLSATFTVDAGYKAFAVSAFMLFEAHRIARKLRRRQLRAPRRLRLA